MKLEAEKIFTLLVQCEPAKDIGDDGTGLLRAIPIVGGSFTGKINGIVLGGGADWNTARTNGIVHVFAKYMLQTHDGVFIAVENEGKIANEQECAIKTSPRFQTAQNSPYGWLNSGVYVGSLCSTQCDNEVKIEVYKLA